ncbi:MAG: hypothetical protein KDD61_10900 [Bdellovibrionales bacterium]|nr:hypothetical protein [Bdellovibrionales bacterium]
MPILRIFITVLLCSSFHVFAKTSPESCLSAREFITTLEYLRSKKDFAMDDIHAQSLAHKVSKGCTGSAQRFITSVEVLSKVEAGTRVAMDIGLKLSQHSDAYAKSFIGLFKKSYLKEYFDLDMQTSLKIATSLSLDYKGNVEQALSDYFKVSEFCIGKEVNLPPPICAQLAQEIVKNNEHSTHSVAEAFIRVYRFVQETESLKSPVKDALAISRKVVAVDPNAATNFIEGYKYAISEKGLKFSAQQSLTLAYQMVERTSVPENPLNSETNRMPASK